MKPRRLIIRILITTQNSLLFLKRNQINNKQQVDYFLVEISYSVPILYCLR